MSALQVGSQIKDNDPRMFARMLNVSRLDETHVYARDASGREYRIQRRRVFTDGKARRTGFSSWPLADSRSNEP